jgi:hypothetical protein
MKASFAQQKERVGNQTGGEPCFVVYTDDFKNIYAALKERGVHFLGKPRESSEDIYVHLEDLYGNQIVLVELRILI